MCTLGRFEGMHSATCVGLCFRVPSLNSVTLCVCRNICTYMCMCIIHICAYKHIEYCCTVVVNGDVCMPLQIDLEQVYELNRKKFVSKSTKSSRRTLATPKEKVCSTYVLLCVRIYM